MVKVERRGRSEENNMFFQHLANGLLISGIYALVAVGFTLIFGVLEVINFGHGEFYMLGAFIVYLFTGQIGLSLFLEHSPLYYRSAGDRHSSGTDERSPPPRQILRIDGDLYLRHLDDPDEWCPPRVGSRTSNHPVPPLRCALF